MEQNGGEWAQKNISFGTKNIYSEKKRNQKTTPLKTGE